MSLLKGSTQDVNPRLNIQSDYPTNPTDMYLIEDSSVYKRQIDVTGNCYHQTGTGQVVGNSSIRIGQSGANINVPTPPKDEYFHFFMRFKITNGAYDNWGTFLGFINFPTGNVGIILNADGNHILARPGSSNYGFTGDYFEAWHTFQVFRLGGNIGTKIDGGDLYSIACPVEEPNWIRPGRDDRASGHLYIDDIYWDKVIV